MTFEETPFNKWFKSYEPIKFYPGREIDAQAAWDAATYAASSQEHPVMTGVNEQIMVCQCHACTQARLSQLERAALVEKAYAANVAAGDASNEAEKDARRKEASAANPDGESYANEIESAFGLKEPQ